MLGNYVFIILKQGGCAFQIKVARNRENIFYFELDVSNI